MDNKFSPLWGDLAEQCIILNICAKNERVPGIEHCIRVVKESSCCAFSGTPFKKLPSVMTDVPVLAAAFCIHAVPAYGGISSTIIPRTIVTGLNIDYHQHCSLEVGKYVQAHKKSGNTNPVGNHQDSWRFMSLTTVNEIIRRKQNTLLMPN